jgi:hypothetical protein
MKYLGKIESVKFGNGGYDNAMFGFSFDLSFGGCGIFDFWGTWSKHHEYCKWTIEEQNEHFLRIFLRVKSLMEDAGVDDFKDLERTPIEVEVDDGTLVSWRILKEVL